MSWKTNRTATKSRLPWESTQFYQPLGTGEHVRLNSSHAARYLIYLLLRDGRLSWS